MTTGLQIVLLAGALVGAGVVAVVHRLLPAEPDLDAALARLSATADRLEQEPTNVALSTTERVGLAGMRLLPAGLWIRTPHQDLGVLRISTARFYGEKLTFTAIGLAAPPLLTVVFSAVDLTFPVVVPAAASLVFAAILFFIPNLNAAEDAKKARLEFTRALSAYVELVALERTNGSGTRQAMEVAAAVGESWVFTRLREELGRSRWSGTPPWDALHTLAGELGLPELDEFADIMRLSGEEGASVYNTLRARSAAMRTAMLTNEVAQANAAGERMSIPGSLLGVIFMAILVAPALLRMLNPT